MVCRVPALSVAGLAIISLADSSVMSAVAQDYRKTPRTIDALAVAEQADNGEEMNHEGTRGTKGKMELNDLGIIPTIPHPTHYEELNRFILQEICKSFYELKPQYWTEDPPEQRGLIRLPS